MGLGIVVRTFLFLILSCSIALGQSNSIIKQSLSKVVMIVVMDENSQPLGIGSGFTVGWNGEIATNYHVVENASSAIVKFVNQENKYPVTSILHTNPEFDIAVIKINANTKPYTLGDDELVGIGERILAIGNPEGLEGTVSEGIISGFRKISESFRLMQITAPISPGSSGGPIINKDGVVLGISSASLMVGQNLNFAIPVNKLKEVQLLPQENITFSKMNLPKSRNSLAGTSTEINNLVSIHNIKIQSHYVDGSATVTLSIQNNSNRDIKNIKLVILWMHKGVMIHYSPILIPDLVSSFYTKTVKKKYLENVGELPRNDLEAEARIMDYEILQTSGVMEFK